MSTTAPLGRLSALLWTVVDLLFDGFACMGCGASPGAPAPGWDTESV